MKYNSTNKPLVCMQTQSTCYKGTRKMDIKGILWHGTGANNPYLKRYIQPSDVRPPEDTYSKDEWIRILGKNTNGNDWNHIKRQAGLNCWIGKLADGTVTTIQTMPWDFRPWGCGSGSKGTCNDGWIQFEICEDDKNDPVYFEAAYREACEVTAYFCWLFGIDPNGTVEHNGIKVPTILCHQDSYKLKLGSNHSDVYNWFNKYERTMNDVRRDVAMLLAGDSFDGNNNSDNNGGNNMRYFEIVDPTGMNMRTAPNKTLVQNIPQGAVISGNSFKTLNGVDWLYTTYNSKTGYVAVLPESKGYAKEVTSQYNQPAPAPAVNWEAKYNEVVGQLTNVNNQISTLTTQVNDLSNANSILNTQLAAANELIDTLENDKVVLDYANEVLKLEKANLENELVVVQKSYDEAKGIIDDFKIAWEKLMK